MPVDGRAHRHDRPPARHRHHRPELVPDALSRARRRDRAVGASCWGASASTTTARSRRTTRRRPTSRGRRCADRRPTTGRPSVPANGSNGHLDTDSHCGIFSDLPAGRQAEAYPTDGEYPSDGIPISAGQVIKLHSEYQNDSGAPKTDVMGIMAAWFVPSPGLPAPEGRDARRACRWCPPSTQCTSSEPHPRPARLPAAPTRGRATRPPELEPADGRHAGRQRRTGRTSDGLREGRR